MQITTISFIIYNRFKIINNTDVNDSDSFKVNT